jgi:hypothetical protein
MPLHAWRRRHGPHIVSQVEPIEGLGIWSASAWLTSNPTVIVRTQRPLHLLTAAHAKADALARITFDHCCDIDTCSEWLPVSLDRARPLHGEIL